MSGMALAEVAAKRRRLAKWRVAEAEALRVDRGPMTGCFDCRRELAEDEPHACDAPQRMTDEQCEVWLNGIAGERTGRCEICDSRAHATPHCNQRHVSQELSLAGFATPES